MTGAVAADRTVVTCDWLFDRVNQQDFAACERTQPSIHGWVRAAVGA